MSTLFEKTIQTFNILVARGETMAQIYLFCWAATIIGAGCVHHLQIPEPTLPPGKPLPEPKPSSIDVPLSIDLRPIAAQVNAEVPAGVDQMGAWTYPRNDAAAGWCGNCRDHCSGGTESECTDACKERCAQAKRNNDWEAKCRAAEQKRDDDCNRNKGGSAEGHFCSDDGDGRKGNNAAVSHWCADGGAGRKGALDAIGDACSGNGWQGCLGSCGGQHDCRQAWCEGDAPERKACYEQNGADGLRFGIKYRATRSPIQISLQGNQLQASTTVEYQAEACYQQKKPWPLSGDICPKLVSCGVGEDMRQALVSMASVVSWTPDWHLDSSTKFSLSYPNRCTVTFLNYDVTPHINDFLIRNMTSASQKIDERVRGQSNIRLLAERGWNELQQPRELTPNTWLVVNPSSFRTSPFNGSGLALNFSVGISARPLIVFGPRPTEPLQPLPALLVEPPGRGFHITVRGDLKYDFLTQRLREEFKNKKLNANGHEVYIRDIRVEGREGVAVVAVAVTIPSSGFGSTQGTAYLTGRPLLDSVTETLFLEELDYSIETKSILVAAFDWLEHDNIRGRLRKLARWQAGPWLAKARAGIESAFPMTLASGVTLQGKVADIAPVGILTTNQEFGIYVDMSGELQLSVDPQIPNAL